VEQYRPAVRKNVIELPAGLAGDLAGEADESLQRAAQREFLEETGYAARSWRRLVSVVSSAGITDEVVTMFLAQHLEKRGTGGGDASEEICVHEIPLPDVERWLNEASKMGKLIDSRVWAGLYFMMVDDGE
jgi:ADP-ribose pyrophosphatase